MDKYYMIYVTECGDVVTREMTKEVLEQEFNAPAGLGYDPDMIVNRIPHSLLENWSGDTIVIIKGQLIMPEPVLIKTQWEFE